MYPGILPASVTEWIAGSSPTMTTGKAALLSGYDHKRYMPYQSLIKAWLAEKVDAVSGASAVPGAR
ncbi:MAG TPA: hypothetical protein VGA77_03955, partial [Propylenella sp.]